MEILLFHQTHVFELFAIGDLARPAHPHGCRDRTVDGLPRSHALCLRTIAADTLRGRCLAFECCRRHWLIVGAAGIIADERAQRPTDALEIDHLSEMSTLGHLSELFSLCSPLSASPW